MNDYLKHLKNDPAYSLSVSERAAMRASLERLTAQSVIAASAAPSRLAHFMSPVPVGAFALLIAVSTSSVSLAAGGALPGELLYGVKREVNERLEVALAPTAEARAVAHVRQAEERLEEAEVLAATSELTQAQAQAAAESVAAQVARAVEAAADLSAEGDAPAAKNVQSRIEIALSAHAELLDAHAENFGGETRDTLQALAMTAREGIEAAALADAGSEGARSVVEEASRTRAHDRLAALSSRLEDADVPPETIEALQATHAELSLRFKDADASIMLDEEAYQSAYDDIDRLAYRALTFLETASRIAKESSKEVVIALASTPPAPEAARAPVALRAKSAEPEPSASLMMASEMAATSSADEAAADLIMPAASMPIIRFELRDSIDR